MVGSFVASAEIERRQDDAEEEPRAVFAADEVRMLALPAEACGLSQRFFHHGGGVDEDFDLAAEFGDERARHVLQALLDDVVIVGALSVDRDGCAGFVFEHRQRIGRGCVGKAEDDGAFCFGPQRFGLRAFGGAGLHPAHVAVMAGRQEFAQALARRFAECGRRKAHGVEALAQRKVADPVARGTHRGLRASRSGLRRTGSRCWRARRSCSCGR